MYKSFIKPLFDFFFSLTAIILLSPLLILVISILAIQNKGKVFFFQERIGKGNKPFWIIKLKTMRDLWDENNIPLADKYRITNFGRKLREWSVDELPQFINILKGDMSLIGPRPLLPEYLPRYNSVQITRHEVKPGITGWTQVKGRNSLSWKEKFELDVWYVRHQSFGLDAKIFYLTIVSVWNRKGINSSQDVPMMKFLGEE